MAAEVESMFYVREKPWHGLGTMVVGAPNSEDALRLAGLDWKIIQKDVFTEDRFIIPGYKVNVRDRDLATLGIVSDRYKVVQNAEAFAFTDELLKEGVRYETAGSLQNGKRVWILARMPEKYSILEDAVEPYFLLMNSHDASSGLTAAMTPIRVVCNNTLNLALKSAQRTWTARHTTNIMSRMSEAQETILNVCSYMDALDKEAERLSKIRLSGQKVITLMQDFFPTDDAGLTEIQKKNNIRQFEDLKARYFDAPDLKDMPNNAYRFINAVSDFATHSQPIRKTQNYQENLFLKTVSGNQMVDKAYKMVAA